MASLEISTVVGCKMMCSYCPQKLHIKNYGLGSTSKVTKMGLDTFQACLSKVPADVEVCFAGMAEPFLNESCVDMILMAHSLGYTVDVYTTTLNMARSTTDAIKHVPFRHFCLHLPDADGLMKMSITPEYLANLSYCVANIKHTKMVIGTIHPEVMAVVGHVPDSTSSLYSRAGNLPGRELPKKSGQLECSSCGPKIDHNVLLPNGDVVLCCMDYGSDHILGNLTVNTYEDLFKSKSYLEVMSGLKDESSDIICRRCEISKTCS